MSLGPSVFVPVVLAFIVGTVICAQAGVNAQLGRLLGHPLHSALTSFAIGTGTLISLALFAPLPPPHWKAINFSNLWVLTGGLLGVVYVTSAVILAPRLGAAAMIGLVVGGQMLSSVVLDHFGWLGFNERPFTWTRGAGVALVLAGVMLILKR